MINKKFMNDKEFEESIKKYYQDKMKNYTNRESSLYVDLNKLIKGEK